LITVTKVLLNARLLVTAVLLGGCVNAAHTTPTVYEIPASYTGWVIVQFDAPAAAALPVESGKRVLRIPPDGFLATSSQQETGILHQEFYQIDANGQRTQLEDVSLRQDIGPRASEMTFPEVVVCCLHTGDRTEDGHREMFEGFYVGRGPSGADPPWPPGRQ
jgi:hypothetical protein